METFDNVWDALENDPAKARNLTMRSDLMIEIRRAIDDRGLKQKEAAEIMQVTQPRVSALVKGNIHDFKIDMLLEMAYRMGIEVSLKFAA